MIPAARSLPGWWLRFPTAKQRPFAVSAAVAERNGGSFRYRTGLDLWITWSKLLFATRGEPRVSWRGRVEPDERYFRRRASEELAAARRAVTDAARERRLMLAGRFLERLNSADSTLIAAE